jgi:hypothetical protein
MQKELEEALQWVAKSTVLTSEKFEIFFLGGEEGNEPKINIISKQHEILASVSAKTYAEALSKAIKQAKEKMYLH